jgi:hypothetical protein
MDIDSAIETLLDAIDQSGTTGKIDDLNEFARTQGLSIPSDVLNRLTHHVGEIKPEHVPCPSGQDPAWKCRPGQSAPNCFSYCVPY